jgi:glycosyltransferase involved in cell wall biosynthesis
MRFFMSNAIDEEKLPFNPIEEVKFGRAHYSWKIVADLYRHGLEAAGIETQIVTRPEIYQSKIAQNVFGVRHDDIHIAVKPIEHIRPFPGMKNIFVAGWEFPQFSTSSFNGNPLNDHIKILKRADQVWCWSNFTTNNLRLYGINAAITMPPPVIIPGVSDEITVDDIRTLALNTSRVPVPTDFKKLADVLGAFENSTIFFSVLNPFDRRKQINLMLTAFQSALSKNQNMILIVKLVIDNIGTTLGNIQEILPAYYGFHGENDRIIFIGETLTKSQMVKLMQKADFYLCTSSTEGLNLPMIESMFHGVVPVSPKASAMADYIHEENSIVIEYEESLTDGPYHYLHNYLPTTHFPPRLTSVIDALILASDISEGAYRSLSDRAKKDVYEKYSVKAFTTKILQWEGCGEQRIV